MLNSKTHNCSVVPSLEGIRKINNRISEIVKKEIVDFIEKSDRRIVLDFKSINMSDEQGRLALKTIVELARISKHLQSTKGIEKMNLNLVKDEFLLGKN